MPSNQKKIRDLQRLLRRKSSNNGGEGGGATGGGGVIGGGRETESAAIGAELPIPHDAADADAQQGILLKIISLQTAREDVKRNMRIRRNAIKYHMVKFLERKKVTRMIRSVDGKLKGTQHSVGLADEDIHQLVKMREQLLEDLAYIMYYPKEMKYVSLFPSKGHDEDDEPPSRDGDRSTVTSAKARSIATKEWRDHLATAYASVTDYLSTADAADIDQGVDNANSSCGMDKVTYAMKVEYFGGSSLGKGMMKGSDDADATELSTMKRKTDTVAVVVASKHKRSSSGGGASGRTTIEVVADDAETDDFFVADGDSAVRPRGSDDPIVPRGHHRSVSHHRSSVGTRQLQSRNDTRHAATKRKFEQHKKVVAKSQQHRKGHY